MSFKRGTIVKLKDEVKTKSKFLHSRGYYVVNRAITVGNHTRLALMEDDSGRTYNELWFDVVYTPPKENEIVKKQKVTIGDIIAKQDFVPSEIDELCDLLTSWNGYIIEKEGIGEW